MCIDLVGLHGTVSGVAVYQMFAAKRYNITPMMEYKQTDKKTDRQTDGYISK